MKQFRVSVAVAALMVASTAQAGTLITTDVGYTGPTLDLTAFQTGNYNFTFGPESIPGGITFVASPGGSGGYPYGGNSGQGSVLGQGGYGLGGNGSFGGSAVYAGVDSGTGYMQFQLSSAVSQFGLYVNYAPGYGDNATIWTLDSSYNPIEAFDLTALAPISTPGGFNQFQFRGVTESSATIWGLRLGGNYILAAASANGAPTPTPTPGIPEPSSWLMMIAGFGLVGYALRNRQNKLARVSG